jgi:hypothetical protein
MYTTTDNPPTIKVHIGKVLVNMMYRYINGIGIKDIPNFHIPGFVILFILINL